MSWRSIAGLALLLAAGCERPRPAEPDPERPPALDAYGEELRAQPLVRLEQAIASLEGRDDLAAIDARRALDLAWRNRGPAEVEGPLPEDLEPEQREREERLRGAWLREHVAYSWDNLDPAAQLEPRPEGLNLTWLVLAHYLPLARNQQQFTAPWVTDYFERKAWYIPRQGPLYLSYIDKVQMDRLEAEVEELEPAELEAWLASLPQPGMSAAEARLEARLAERLLAGGTVFEDPR